MAINYVNLAAVAKRLIEENGRPVVLVQMTTTVADAAMPWRGTTGADVTRSMTAVNFDYKAEDVDGERIKRGDQRLLVAATSMTAGTDLTKYDQVQDTDGAILKTYRIVKARKITPGPTDVYWELQLRE